MKKKPSGAWAWTQFGSHKFRAPRDIIKAADEVWDKAMAQTGNAVGAIEAIVGECAHTWDAEHAHNTRHIPAWKREVLDRDGWRCRVDSKIPVTVHHVIFKSQGGKDIPSNGLTLCYDCHEYAHREALGRDSMEEVMFYVKEEPRGTDHEEEIVEYVSEEVGS